MRDRRLCLEDVHVSDSHEIDWTEHGFHCHGQSTPDWTERGCCNYSMRDWTVRGCLHETLKTVWMPPSLPLDAMALKLHCPLLSVLTEGALCDCYEIDIRNG